MTGWNHISFYISSSLLIFINGIIYGQLFTSRCGCLLIFDMKGMWGCLGRTIKGDVGTRSTIIVFVFFIDSTLQNANIYNLLHIWEHISTWQPWLQRWRQEPHLESPGNFSCLANSHMCQTSPPTLHISRIPQECLLFLPGLENGSNASLSVSSALVQLSEVIL